MEVNNATKMSRILKEWKKIFLKKAPTKEYI